MAPSPASWPPRSRSRRRRRALSRPALSVSAAILVAPSTGQELYGVNPNAEVPIASTTKLMTALITLEHVRRLGQVFTLPD